MKKVIIVSKTHLDLGFTDYAENVFNKYMNTYIPNAVETANNVNTGDKKKFVWTTGSWLLKKALRSEKGELVRKALEEGNIAPHAIPFTLHTELLDEKSLDYALSMVDELDEITGRKTTAAKMTDVPGHTLSLVPLLYKHGVKLLHIGVNGASAMPEVPECFLWRHESGAEVIVIYSGSYGGEFRCDLVDEILYFDHTVDNRGARNEKDTIAAYEKVAALYPGYEVEAGRMDDFADALWEKRDALPVITNEIGDTWIHGAGSDPFKSAALRELIGIKNRGVEDGLIDTFSDAYDALMDAILCTAEHTCGGDSKVFLSDYSHYDKEAFAAARKNDDVTQSEDIAKTEYGLDVIEKRKTGEYNEGSYRALEKAWQEQRNYINTAVSCLPDALRQEAEAEIEKLRPGKAKLINDTHEHEIESGCLKVCAGCDGSLSIYKNGKAVFDSDGRAPIAYMAFSADDYDCWLGSYTRDFEDNHIWSLPDFCRPFLHSTDGKYAFGEYSPMAEKISCDGKTLLVDFATDEAHGEKLGCPRHFQLSAQIENEKIKLNVTWLDKDASRIPEATFLRLYPVGVTSLRAKKCGGEVNLRDIVENGNRRLCAAEKIILGTNSGCVKITNRHSPLFIGGFCNLVRFSNEYPSVEKDGVSFVLHDSIWGTNFPLWYEDNASFDFEIEI